MLRARLHPAEPGLAIHVGPPLVFQRIWSELGLPEVLADLLRGQKFEFPLERAISMTVLHRLMVSGSDRAAEQWCRRHAIDQFVYPWLIGASHLLRGLFAEAHLTPVLGHATLYKVLLLLACWPPLMLLALPFSGGTVAIVLLIAAEAVETWYLHVRRRRLLGGQLPASVMFR